jgi:hypothetical protein
VKRLLDELKDWAAAILTVAALLGSLVIADAIWRDYDPNPAGQLEEEYLP